MTAATSTSGIPGPRRSEAAPEPALREEAAHEEAAAEPSADAVYRETMARFTAMYEEWCSAVRAIRDA